MPTVTFQYRTGLKRNLFDNVRLEGSWHNGRYSEEWSSTAMTPRTGEDGCPVFEATVAFDESQVGRRFCWGVRGDRTDPYPARDLWLILTEVKDSELQWRHREFELRADGQTEVYRLCHSRCFGANKLTLPGDVEPRAQFAVWAPNAQEVSVVFGSLWNRDLGPEQPYDLNPGAEPLPVERICGGHIADDGYGQHSGRSQLTMRPDTEGIWRTDPADPELRKFADLDHKLYMFKVTRDDGREVYRTDLFSRCQVGSGSSNPRGAHYDGAITDLDGGASCSVVVDPDTVTARFKTEEFPEKQFISEQEFWADEFTPGRPVPRRVEDLVIYELHTGALGFGRPGPGTLEDAIALLDHLEALGVNAVELLPLSEFAGGAQNWGYATSHYFAIEYGGGGRDQYKYFVRECHRRGIAVIMDAVYNHYAHDAERAEWMFDTASHERNIYYWYEGMPGDYVRFNCSLKPEERHRRGQGGYVDNMSTGWAPRYHEENVRKMFISSALALVEEFHIDGFRVDQTTSIHAYNCLHADGRAMSSVNAFGGKLLRELTRSLKLVRPEVILMAEDHSDDLDYVVRPAGPDGLGFDAAWYANFYHHLIGDTNHADKARLLKQAGFGDQRGLDMDAFAATIESSGHRRVVYHESHDEAGNGHGTERTIVTAVNGVLSANTRPYAEARCRLVAGLAMLSAGTPMFLFGEEVGAAKPFLYNRVLDNREDIESLRDTSGARLFDYYAALTRLRRTHESLRSRAIGIVFRHRDDRILAFRRGEGDEQCLILASFNNRPFPSGYVMNDCALPDTRWREIFNSDAERYGGGNVGNFGQISECRSGHFEAVLPANGLIVFAKE